VAIIVGHLMSRNIANSDLNFVYLTAFYADCIFNKVLKYFLRFKNWQYSDHVLEPKNNLLWVREAAS